jgi:hypothetical protein
MKKELALQKIDTAAGKGALVYVSREEISELPDQYMPLVSELFFKKDDFASVGQGNFYPLKSATNRIAEATGVGFTNNCGTKTKGDWSGVHIVKIENVFQAEGEYAIIGYAQGTRMKTDGTPRTSPVQEYEFSVTDRFNLDMISSKYPPKTLIEARKKMLDVKKFSTQRASTGAELMVVRYLAAIPTGFKEADITKPMLFGQYVENPVYKAKILNEISKTPAGQAAIANHLMGATNNLYGNQISAPEESSGFEDVETVEAEIVQEESQDNNSPFDDATIETGELSPVDVAKLDLEGYLNDPIVQSSKKHIVGIQRMIADKSILIETLKIAIEELEKFRKGQMNG